MRATTHDVLCVGNAIVDVIAHAEEAFLSRHGMAKGTMQLVDGTQAAAIYAEMGSAVEVSGGSAGNTAAGIASLGGRAAFIGKVGRDQLGEVFAHDLRATGVRFDPPPVEEGSDPTATCLVLVTPDAQRTMSTHLGISSQIAPPDVSSELVAEAAITYCEGYLWDQPSAKAAITRAMDLAREAGRKVAFTLSDPFCVDRHRHEFLELVEGRVDILFANEAELCSLYEVEVWEAAVGRVRGHVELACLTRSEHGSVVVHAHDEITVPAAPVAEVVDTTGAGDLYAAGFLYGLTHDLDLERCGELGALAAAEVISHLGARPEDPLRRLAEDAGLL